MLLKNSRNMDETLIVTMIIRQREETRGKIGGMRTWKRKENIRKKKELEQREAKLGMRKEEHIPGKLK